MNLEWRMKRLKVSEYVEKVPTSLVHRQRYLFQDVIKGAQDASSLKAFLKCKYPYFNTLAKLLGLPDKMSRSPEQSSRDRRMSMDSNHSRPEQDEVPSK